MKGYRDFAVDGNHLQESEKRLEPLRMLHDAPLPGTTVARFDLQRRMFDRAYLLVDAHAQESSVLDRVLGDLQQGDLPWSDRLEVRRTQKFRVDEPLAARIALS